MIGKRLSHYRIEEKIGAGGMGVVYRAHDEQLDRDVAIKVLPSRSLADETTQKQFRREALSLARLNHPNVATVHEFGTQDGIDFLVTEYISGIAIDARLAAGPLPVAEVFRLGLQMAQGLAAAHQQGIVHRDLKPGNLRLTRDGRLKILDFGLAQFMPQPSDLGLTVTVTKSQETTGTLPYMAPEQLRGEGADARCDVWAAGAVLYEMATGRRPFAQTNAPLLIDAILNRPFEPASRLNPEVPPVLDEVIRKALAKDPSQRYQTGGELAVALELPVSTGTAPVFPAPAPAKRAKPYLASALIVALLAVASAAYLFMHRKKDAGSAPPTAIRRRSIAVLGFKNLSGSPEKSWLSTALSELMTTELSQGDELRTIPGESVAQMRMSLAIPDADSYSQQTLNRIRQNLGSDDVVVGSYLPLGNGVLRLDLRMQDALAGETLATVSEKGKESEIDTLVGKAGAKLRAKLGIAALSDQQSAAVRTSLPSNPEAARLYGGPCVGAQPHDPRTGIRRHRDCHRGGRDPPRACRERPPTRTPDPQGARHARGGRNARRALAIGGERTEAGRRRGGVPPRALRHPVPRRQGPRRARVVVADRRAPHGSARGRPRERYVSRGWSGLPVRLGPRRKDLGRGRRCRGGDEPRPPHAA